ncbi:hypothetical protein [Aliikangiella maris]|uniref:Uncharacterized protein n=2 Tax=Aliikangiella maris TaxID=3162458 RepID=A0ABV3MR09_9GAMM
MPSITITSPTHIATIKLKGAITLQSAKPVDFATLTKTGFEITAKREADVALGKLVTNSQSGYNAKTNEITLEMGITTHSNVPYSPKTTVAAGVSSKTGLPVLKGNIEAPEIKGKLGDFHYVTGNLAFAIEITPRPPTAKPQPVPVPAPSAKPVPQRDGCDYLWGSLLIAGAGLLIVATIAEDVVTLGVGVADDVPSFAAAAAMFAGGVMLFKPVNGGTPIHVESHGLTPEQL